jgi:hypothetical protein
MRDPVNTSKTLEVLADTRGRATCRGTQCRARITWYEVAETGKKMPFTGDPVALSSRHDSAGRLILALPFEDSHWRTCPDWLAFKSRRG